MSEITCLRCKKSVDEAADTCPECGEKITSFQRTYSQKLIDGKYQILERLGIGGMGEIFKVRHIHLNEQRVIKIMRANIATDEQALQRFLHEARTSTMIKHRNLAMLYDFSTLDDGSYYMVWEFIDGTNIQKWMAANGVMPPRLALEIAVQTLHGLDHLHQMGLIHRDISPENIMLSQDHHGRLLVKVIDFGIAKQLSEGGGGHGLTQTGMFLGKLKYASPEQAGFIREGETLDPRSDLYSFGVVLYEMLAGRAPFVATNPQGYILKHATEKPLPITQVNAAVTIPEKLEEQVMIALEKDRDHRHLSAADFAAELEEIRDEIPGDDKFDLGDARITVGRTYTDRTRIGRTSSGPQRTVAPAGTGSAATLVDASAEEPTIVTGPRETVVGDRPTVVNRTAEATVVDRAATGTTAEAVPTVIAPLEKRGTKLPMIAAAAAIVVLLAAGGIWYAMRDKDGPAIVTDTAEVTKTDVGPVVIPGGQGEILLNASPYGSLERILNAETGQPVPFEAPDGKGTPLRVPLDPGTYQLVVAGPEEVEQRTVSVTVKAGQRESARVTFPQLDLEKVTEEILSQ
jgi:serine/threonine protein kinase